MEVFERVSGEGAGIFDQGFHNRVPIPLEGAAVKGVDRIAIPAIALCRNSTVIVQGVADSKDLPASSGSPPSENAIFAQVLCDVEDTLGSGRSIAGGVGEIVEQFLGAGGRPGETLGHSFVLPVLQEFASGWIVRLGDGISDDGDIAIQFGRVFWNFEFDLHLAAREDDFAPHQFLGGVFRLDHGATQVPAALDVQTHFESEPMSFVQGELVEFAPLGTEEVWTVGNSAVAKLFRTVGVANEGAAKAFGGHLF